MSQESDALAQQIRALILQRAQEPDPDVRRILQVAISALRERLRALH